MSRRDPERLHDVLEAIEAINEHVARGDLSDGLIFDAVRVRLIEIGEAIKSISPQLLATEPSHPWSDIARMRDRLAHRYFDTTHSQVAGAVHQDLGPLRNAILRLQDRVQATEQRAGTPDGPT
ncbi:MAG: HepT-like ribonuclease domain-containing protein [Actinomycetota bacterium]